MIDFKQKRNIRKIVYSPIVMIFLLIILIILLRGLWSVNKKAILSRENLEKEKIELQKIIEREKDLNSSIEYLKTDMGIESEIRSKFRAVKSGEKLAVIIDDQTATNTPNTTIEKRGFFYKLFNFFMI